MIIELRPETEMALTAYATRRGLTPDEIADEILRDRLHELNETNNAVAQDANKLVQAPDNEEPEDEFAGGTLADLFTGRIGVVDSGQFIPGGAQMSQVYKRKFAEGMLEKKRLGKL